MTAEVAGRPWGEWTEEELTGVVKQLRYADSLINSLAKRVHPKELTERSERTTQTSVTINIGQLSLFDSSKGGT